MIPGPDHLPWLDGLLAEAAVRELMPRFGRLGAAEVAQKTSAFDVVTAADEACEAAITQVLRARHPGALVVGEEAAGRDPGLLDALAEAELAFVLDPLDGTWNFAAGLPLFGVMLAVVSRGQVLGSVIHDPVSRSSAIDRSRASAALTGRCASTVSTICWPTVYSGLSDVSGSWKIAPMRRPRM